MSTQSLIVIIIFGLLTIFICQTLLHRQKQMPKPSIRVVLDSEDYSAFREVIKILNPDQIEGATYDDNGDVTVIEFIVCGPYYRDIFEKLSKIQNIEVAEVS